MLKLTRIGLNAMLTLAVALVMGFGLSEGLLNSFIPHSWALPGVVLSTIGFFFMVRWLKTEPDSKEELPHNADFATAPRAALPAGFSFQEENPLSAIPLKTECCGSQS